MAFQILVCHHRRLNFYGCKTGDYRQRMEGVFVKAAIKRGQKSLLILLSVSRLGRRPRRSSSEYKDLQPRM